MCRADRAKVEACSPNSHTRMPRQWAARKGSPTMETGPARAGGREGGGNKALLQGNALAAMRSPRAAPSVAPTTARLTGPNFGRGEDHSGNSRPNLVRGGHGSIRDAHLHCESGANQTQNKPLEGAACHRRQRCKRSASPTASPAVGTRATCPGTAMPPCRFSQGLGKCPPRLSSSSRELQLCRGDCNQRTKSPIAIPAAA